jgi:hypothetical protein
MPYAEPNLLELDFGQLDNSSGAMLSNGCFAHASWMNVQFSLVSTVEEHLDAVGGAEKPVDNVELALERAVDQLLSNELERLGEALRVVSAGALSEGYCN